MSAAVKALTDDRRASVSMARTKVSGPGGTQCELDATLTVEEDGGTSTTNIWKCTTTVDTSGDGGAGTPVPNDGGGGSGGGSGSGSGGTTPPAPEPRECRPAKDRIEVQGVLWRQECAGKGLRTCCTDKANRCIEECGLALMLPSSAGASAVRARMCARTQPTRGDQSCVPFRKADLMNAKGGPSGGRPCLSDRSS